MYWYVSLVTTLSQNNPFISNIYRYLKYYWSTGTQEHRMAGPGRGLSAMCTIYTGMQYRNSYGSITLIHKSLLLPSCFVFRITISGLEECNRRSLWCFSKVVCSWDHPRNTTKQTRYNSTSFFWCTILPCWSYKNVARIIWVTSYLGKLDRCPQKSLNRRTSAGGGVKKEVHSYIHWR